MLGRTSGLLTANRERMMVLAIGAIIGLSILAPSSAHASGCTDSWTNTAGGNWFTGSNWSNEAPPTSEEEACITASGTYTVTMTQATSTVSVRSLTVGGATGKQTLVVGSSCSVNAVLTATAGITNGSNGAITLTNGDSCGSNATLEGPVSNAGALTVEPGAGGSRSLQGEFTNTGTLAINTNTAYNGTSALLTNKGAIDIAAGKELTVSGKNSLTNSGGGSITAAGSGGVLMSGTKFTEGGGKAIGTKPVIVDDGALSYTGTGKSLIALRGSSTLSGNLAAGQSLSIESTCGENATATAGASFTNGGAITLTNGDNCGDNATLVVSVGTLTNSGKITTEPAEGGARTLQGNITNTGTIAIDASTAYNGAEATLTNNGEINLPEAVQLTVSEGGSIINGVGGKISATGTADVFMDSGTSFTEGAGATSGIQPVIVDDGTLNYTGSGRSQIALRGSTTLTGSLGSEQSLSIESTCGENATATAGASFTNGGAITLTNGDNCGNNATLAVSAGTLTNTGKVTTEPAEGGARTLQGNITNTGKLIVKVNTAYNGADALLANEGEVSLSEGIQLTVSNGGSVVNGSSGKISAIGTADIFMDSGTSFTEGAGTITGTQPVIIDDGTLGYTGSGTGLIALRGSNTLSGDLVAGQSLSIESTCGENAIATAGASFTNGGTITLTNGDNCGNNATLAVSAGTLTNSGRIVTEPANGGARSVQGNLTNTSAGTVAIKTNTAYNAADAAMINEGTINISEGTQLAVSNGGSVTNSGAGNISAPGSATLFQTGGTFTEGAGKVSGSIEPVILDDATLVYTGTSAEHGSGRIELRGASTLSGNVRLGEVLEIASTCSENAVATTTTTSFFTAGTVELTNGDNCGNGATLNLKGGKLTNDGKLDVDNPHGGVRSIEGSLINTYILSISAGETLKVSGSYTQTSAGTFKTNIASASEFGAISAAGSATLAGALKLIQVSPFKASLGQTYAILNSASLTGTFAVEAAGQINSTGLYYRPSYSATGVTLVVTQATLLSSAQEGLPGASVTLTGSGYLPGDTITLTFTDHKGVQTTFPSVTTNGSGEYSTEITIPASAASGSGTIKATSTQTGVHVSVSFKVT